MPKRLLLFLFVIAFFAVLILVWPKKKVGEENKVTNFEQCVAAGNKILESYPRQCSTLDGHIFVESNIPEK
jgi:hypothetical protein